MKSYSRIAILLLLAFSLAMPVLAHPGNTDSNGGHTDRSTGEYHYHHGYPEHQHWDMDGDGDIDCPYDFEDKTKNNTYRDSLSNSNGNSKPPKEESAFLGFVKELLKFIGMIAIGFSFYGVLFLKIKIEEALEQRRFKKGKKKNHTLPWLLLSLLFVSISVGTIVYFFMNDPQLNLSAIAASNLMDTILQILGLSLLTVPVALFVLFIVIIIIVGMWDRIPKDEEPNSVLLKAAAVNATLATAFTCLLLLSAPLLR